MVAVPDWVTSKIERWLASTGGALGFVRKLIVKFVGLRTCSPSETVNSSISLGRFELKKQIIKLFVRNSI